MSFQSMTIPTEAGNIEVSSRIQAKRMIMATCYAVQFTLQEAKEHEIFNDIAGHFNIDMDLIRMCPSENREAAEFHGYYNEYYFEE